MPSNAVRELAGSCAVVTGSSTGIGRAIALELAAAGADLVVHYHRSQAAADETATMASAHGVRVTTIAADLADEQGCRTFLEAAWNALGTCQIWVNNAGADTLTGTAGALSFDRKLELLWSVDVRATIWLAREAARRMQACGGVILNMGWDQAETGMDGDSGQLFSVAKGAIMAFSKSLACSTAPAVRVNCLAPGWIRTAWGEQASDAWQKRAVRETPLGRWGTPEDVARVARFLCSPAAAFLTGQVVRINGGAVR